METRAHERLEPCEGKLSCTVLRGERNSNVPDLLDCLAFEGWYFYGDEDDIKDLLTDLMHFCERMKIDFEGNRRVARDNYVLRTANIGRSNCKHPHFETTLIENIRALKTTLTANETTLSDNRLKT